MKTTRAFAAAASIIALGALCSAGASAQGLRLKGGLSYSNVSNSGALPGSLKQRSGFAAGIAIASSGAIGFGVEGLYAQRGLKSSIPANSIKFTYVDVPLYLRLAIPTSVLSPFVYAGPQASFELSCKTDVADCADTGRPKTSYAGVIGAGVRFGQRGISLEARYVYGLTDLKLSTVTTTDSYKTRSFLLLAGIGF